LEVNAVSSQKNLFSHGFFLINHQLFTKLQMTIEEAEGILLMVKTENTNQVNDVNGILDQYLEF
jgi:hypothetical protein